MRRFLPMRIGGHIRILGHICDIRAYILCIYAQIFAVGAFSRTRMAIPDNIPLQYFNIHKKKIKN